MTILITLAQSEIILVLFNFSVENILPNEPRTGSLINLSLLG